MDEPAMSPDETPIQELIIASASPRRRDLLAQAGFDVRVICPPLDEPDDMGHDVPVAAHAEALSYFKARSVAAMIERGILIAADTLVAFDSRVYGKPTNENDARRILETLAGTTHQVVTGVTLLDAATARRLISHDITTVTMRPMPRNAMERYLAGGSWKGKAGAYGIQDHGDAFIESIDGSFTNVVGLPMELLTSMLEQWGIAPTASNKTTPESV